MFTSLDKALVALIMSAVFVVNNFTSFHFFVDEQLANSIVAVLMPVLVYVFPNKPSSGLSGTTLRSIAPFLIILSIASITLVGCAGKDSPERTVFNIRASYVVLLTAAVQYESLPRCELTELVICSKTSVVEEMRRADLAAKATLDSAEALVQKHGEVNAAFAVDAAGSAVDAFAKVLALYGVK